MRSFVSLNRQATQEQSQDSTGYSKGKGSHEGKEEIDGCMNYGIFVHAKQDQLACVYLHFM